MWFCFIILCHLYLISRLSFSRVIHSARVFFLFSKSIPSVLVRLSMHKDTNILHLASFRISTPGVCANQQNYFASTDVPPHHCTICLVSPSCIKLPGTSSKSSFSISPLCDITLQLISLSTSACWASRILSSFSIKRDGPEAFKVKHKWINQQLRCASGCNLFLIKQQQCIHSVNCFGKAVQTALTASVLIESGPY